MNFRKKTYQVIMISVTLLVRIELHANNVSDLALDTLKKTDQTTRLVNQTKTTIKEDKGLYTVRLGPSDDKSILLALKNSNTFQDFNPALIHIETEKSNPGHKTQADLFTLSTISLDLYPKKHNVYYLSIAGFSHKHDANALAGTLMDTLKTSPDMKEIYSLENVTQAPPNTGIKPDKTNKIQWKLKDADIHEVIAKVAAATGRSFIIETHVEGKFSLITGKPLSNEELYPIFVSLLEGAGFAAIPVGSAIKIVPIETIQSQKLKDVTLALEKERSQNKLTSIANNNIIHGIAMKHAKNHVKATDNAALTDAIVLATDPKIQQLPNGVSVYAPSNTLVFSEKKDRSDQSSLNTPSKPTLYSHSEPGPFQPLWSTPQGNDMQSFHWDTKMCDWNGPLQLGIEYSRLFGFTAETSFEKVLTPQSAIHAELDVGTKQNREAFTAGFAVNEFIRSKFTVERLEQTIPINFHSGTVRTPLEQYGVGGEMQVFFNNQTVRALNIGGNYIQGGNKNFSDLTYIDNAGNVLFDNRRISGVHQVGLVIGTDLVPIRQGFINVSVNVENVHFYNRNVPETNMSRFGFGVKGEQLIFNREAKLDFLGARHALYSELHGAIHWFQHLKSNSIISYGLGVRHYMFRYDLPNDTRVEASLALMWRGKTRSKASFACPEPQQDNLGQWVATPAVYSPAILFQVDESNVNPNPHPTPPNPPTPIFSPSIITVWAGDNFTSSAAFSGNKLSFNFETIQDGVTVSGLPSWVSVNYTNNAGNITVTLSGVAPPVQTQSDYTFIINSTHTQSKEVQSGSLVLHVVPRLLNLTQEIENQVPAVFALVNENVSSGQYSTLPPTTMENIGTFNVIAQGASVIQGSFTYQVTTGGNPLRGMGCIVLYNLDLFGNLSETATPIPSSSGTTPVCSITLTQGMSARAILNIHEP